MLLVLSLLAPAFADPIVPAAAYGCWTVPTVAFTVPFDGQMVPTTVQPFVQLRRPCDDLQIQVVLTDVTNASTPTDVELATELLSTDQAFVPLALDALPADHDFVLQVIEVEGETLATVRFSTTEDPPSAPPEAPEIRGLALENTPFDDRVVATATLGFEGSDGFVALFPADPGPLELVEAAAADADPAFSEMFVHALLVEGLPDAETCLVAHRRSASGQWSPASDPMCARSVPPPAPISAARGCTTVTGVGALHPLLLACILPLVLIAPRRRH